MTSCQSGPPPQTAPAREAAGPVRQYSLEGVVVRVDAADRIATIKHGPIKDASGELWMEAMTMEYPVPDPQDLAKLRPGQNIRATVHSRESDSEYWLSGVTDGPGRPLTPDPGK
jgi:Cu/Ag efflux protein CusF